MQKLHASPSCPPLLLSNFIQIVYKHGSRQDFINFPGNRALGGATIQSSTSADWFAEKAVDGNRGLRQLYTGCSSTLNETDPWWRLDLHDVYRVSKVVVTK